MDKFLSNWLPNIVVTGFFWLLDHAPAVLGLVVVLRAAFARVKAMWPRREGDLVPGAMSGASLTTSMGAANVTAAPQQPPHSPFSDGDWHNAVQANLLFERGKMAAVLAGSEYLGSPRVLLDNPPTS